MEGPYLFKKAAFISFLLLNVAILSPDALHQGYFYGCCVLAYATFFFF